MSIELKKYIVVGGENGLPEIWHTETYRDVDKNNPEHFKGYRIITTFNADEQLTEPGQPVPAGEGLPRSIEEMIAKEPVTFFLANALKYLDENQKIALRDALIERTPKQEDNQ